MIKSGWLSGHQPGLPPLQPRFNPEVARGVSFGRPQPDCEGFSPGTPVFLPPQNRLPVNYIWLGLRCSEITHGSYGGSRAAPSHAFDPIPLSRLILKSPCREWLTKHIYICFSLFCLLFAGAERKGVFIFRSFKPLLSLFPVCKLRYLGLFHYLRRPVSSNLHPTDKKIEE